MRKLFTCSLEKLQINESCHVSMQPAVTSQMAVFFGNYKKVRGEFEYCQRREKDKIEKGKMIL